MKPSPSPRRAAATGVAVPALALTALLSSAALVAWREAPASGQLQGHTLYGGHQLVFSRHGRLPWVPVSTAEYLADTLRDLQRSQQAETQVRAAVPAASDAAAREAHDEAQVQTMAPRVRAWREGLSPQQRAAPALLGLNGLHDPAAPLLCRSCRPWSTDKVRLRCSTQAEPARDGCFTS